MRMARHESVQRAEERGVRAVGRWMPWAGLAKERWGSARVMRCLRCMVVVRGACGERERETERVGVVRSGSASEEQDENEQKKNEHEQTKNDLVMTPA